MSTAKKQLTSCPPKTAVAYARYSSASQRDVSIEQQLQDIRAYAEREGYTILHEYVDRAKSGFKNSERRAAFQAMLRDASTGSFDTVLAWKVDRFGRNRRESSQYKGQLADLGVSVVYAMEPIPDGAAGALTEGMLEAIAEWYSRNLSENIRRGKRDNAHKGLYNGIKIFGYDKGPDGHYVINEPEAAIVRRIFSLYAQGYSTIEIPKMFSKEGIVASTGNRLGNSRILYTISNPAYIGTYHFDDIIVPNGMPAIIDKETWDICQSLRKKTVKHRERHPDVYLLSGKCYCGLCGYNVQGLSGKSRGKNFYYYACSKKRRFQTCSSKFIPNKKIEPVIIDFMFKNVLSDERLKLFADSIIEALKAQQEISPARLMENQLADITRRITNINRAIAEGIWTPETGNMLKDLSAQAEELKKNIAYQHLTDKQAVDPDRVRFILEKIAKGNRDDREALKTLIGTFINSITIYENWLRIVVNAADYVEKIPPEELPPLDEIPELSRFDFQPNASNRLVTVEPYPVIVFKIAI